MLKLTREKAMRLRALIEKAVISLDDEDALEAVTLFHNWEVNHSYAVDDRFRYNEKLYKVVQAHVSQADWLPDMTPALYTEVAEPGVIPVWRQPSGAQDAYSVGDKVRYPDENGSIYESMMDSNVWSPESYPAGWKLIE